MCVRYIDPMSDSLDRLHKAVTRARDGDTAFPRTSRLLAAGRGKIAKKMAEEAVEVVIDAMNGQSEAVIRESADLLYNLTVLWVAAGISPREVWDEMDRRERLYGIAEKIPKQPLALVEGPSEGRRKPARAMPPATRKRI